MIRMPFGSKYTLMVANRGLIFRLFQIVIKLLGYPLYIGDRVRAYNTMRDLNPSPSDMILDAGCGIGVYSLECALKGAVVIGIDISKEAVIKGLRAAKAAHLDTRLFFLIGDICNLPIKDNIFDKVLCVDVLEHINDDTTALHELYRVLKNKSIIVVHVPKKKQSYVFLKDKIDYRNFGHVREGYTFETLKFKLEEAQFTIDHYKETFKTFSSLAWKFNYMFRGKKFALLLFPLLYGLSRLDFLLGNKSSGQGLLIVAKTHK